MLTGHGTFVDDVVRPGMLHACFVRSPFARARIVSIDPSAALALAGVHAVFTAADLNPGVHEAWYALVGKDVPDSPRPPLAEDEVRFVGDLVALVVADDRYVAEDAADLVDVDYEPLTAVVDYATAETNERARPRRLGRQRLRRAGRAARRAAGPGVRRGGARRRGDDPPAGLRRRRRWRRAASSSSGRAADQELTVWAATQSPHEVRMFAARLLGVPENRDAGDRPRHRRRVRPEGQRRTARTCACCSPRSKVPAALKWIEDRRENLMASSSRHEQGRVRMAFDADGTFLAATIDHVQDIGAYPMPWPVFVAAAVGMIFPGPYRLPNATFTTKCVFSNTPGAPPTAGRGSSRPSPAR